MSHFIMTSIALKAAPERIWRELTDFAATPVWNPFFRSIEGRPAVGERLRVCVAPPGLKEMCFNATVRAARPARELRWHSSLPVPGLFNAEYFLVIEPMSDGRSMLFHGEVFWGLIAPFVLRQPALESIRQGFEAMSIALRARLESDRVG